jgi:hypothetical protein
MIINRAWNACLSGVVLLLLTACHSDGSSSGTTSSGPSQPEAGTVTSSISVTVKAMSGASETLSIPFNASEASPAANLTVTGLASLPVGWSAPAEFSCASVSTGNGCMLTLTFAPTTATSGTLSLTYTYTDNRGAAQSGSLSVPYSSTTNDNVVAIASPSGQVAATVSSGTQPVTVTFDTDDGAPATAVTLSNNLNALPAGWSSTATSFSCATVSTGSSCQLPLSYSPTAFGSGTLTLNYSYIDNSGNSKTGTVSIPYSATTNNNIVATASTSGQVTGYVGIGSQSVTLNFATDDGNPATAFAVTTALSSLPAGWTSNPTSLTCASVTTGNSCQFTLNYAPPSAGTGSLQIAYSYQSNSGVAKTGTVSVPYSSTAPHAYIVDPNANGYLCSINSDSTLSGCTSLGLPNNVTDFVFNGSTVYYSSVSNQTISACTVATDGTFSNCATAATGMNGPEQLSIQGSRLYIANSGAAAQVCSIDPASGALSNCTTTGSVSSSQGIAFAGNYAYTGSGTGGAAINVCSVDSTTGLLSNCAATSQNAWYTLTAANGYLYTTQGAGVGVCPISGTGTLPTCTTSTIATGVTQTWGITMIGSKAYVATSAASGAPFFTNTFNIYLCSVSPTDGSLSSCTISNGGAFPYFLLHVIIH